MDGCIDGTFAAVTALFNLSLSLFPSVFPVNPSLYLHPHSVTDSLNKPG